MPALFPVQCHARERMRHCLVSLEVTIACPRQSLIPMPYLYYITAVFAVSPVEVVLYCLLMASELQTTTSAKGLECPCLL